MVAAKRNTSEPVALPNGKNHEKGRSPTQTEAQARGAAATRQPRHSLRLLAPFARQLVQEQGLGTQISERRVSGVHVYGLQVPGLQVSGVQDSDAPVSGVSGFGVQVLEFGIRTLGERSWDHESLQHKIPEYGNADKRGSPMPK